MSVLNDDRRLPYPGNGVANVFSGPRLFSPDELSVFLVNDATGVPVLQSVTSQYTVASVGLGQSVVTMFTPPAAGETLILERALEMTQPARFRNQGAFFPELHEDAFDRAAMRDQQLKDGVDRSLKLPAGSSGISLDMPSALPLGLVGWNASGTALQNYTPDTFGAAGTVGVTHEYPVAKGAVTLNISDIVSPFAVGSLYYNGVHQSTGAYSVVGTTLTFSEPLPADGMVSITAVFVSPEQVGNASIITYTPSDGTGSVALSAQLDELKTKKTTTLDLKKDFGAVGNGITNDTVAVKNWLIACNAEKRIGTADGGTYLHDSIQIFSLNDLHIECHLAARFKGTKTYQVFPGNGTTGQTFVVTDFVLQNIGGGVPGIIRAGRVSAAGLQTGLVLDVDYSVAGNAITLLGATTISLTETLRAVSSEALIHLLSTGTGKPHLSWEGGIIDCSERGALGAEATGSGLNINNWKKADLSGIYLYSADDYVAGLLKGVGDSGITPSGTHNTVISNCLFQGWTDLGIYATGGGLTTSEDDGVGLVLQGNTFLGCSAGWKAARGTRNVLSSGNVYEKCNYGALFWHAGVGTQVGHGVITGEIFRRCGSNAIACWGQFGGQISNNTIIDSGYLFDGTTPATGVNVGIDVAGSTGVTVTDNVMRWHDLPVPAGYTGIKNRELTINSVVEQPSYNTFHNNTIFNIAKGIEETGAFNGTNRYRDNRFVFVADPLPGVPTQCKSAGTYAPIPTISTNITAVSVVDTNLRFYRQDDMVHVYGQLNIQPAVGAGFTQAIVPLPIPSNFGGEATSMLSGTCSDGYGQHGRIYAFNNTVGQARVHFTANTALNRPFSIHFSYPVVI